jgi:hypothetical protein
MSGKDTKLSNITLFREIYKTKKILDLKSFTICIQSTSLFYKKPKPNISGIVPFPTGKRSVSYVLVYSKTDKAQKRNKRIIANLTLHNKELTGL